jgi:hypothetical protein
MQVFVREQRDLPPEPVEGALLERTTHEICTREKRE